ncbi:MAG: site-2 protease family protein [Ruminococcaceae bacterium]|nr:site-2 protease family protein [Oscillospiraceae bacterium]
MLMTFLSNRNTFTTIDLLFLFLAYGAVLLVCLPVHEFAHGLVAYWCGDRTAKYQGRLSLNPFRHLDLMGTLMILTVGIGYAKPVPVNTYNLRNRKRDMILVAMAGPISNFLMALLSAGIFRICCLFVHDVEMLFSLWILLVGVMVSVNISLMVFNLLPVPPLDGSRLWSSLLPGRWAYTLEQYSQYITIGLFVLLFTGALDVPLDFMRDTVGGAIGFLVGEPDLLDFNKVWIKLLYPQLAHLV